MNTNIICKILRNNTKFLLLSKECLSKKYLFLFLFNNKQKLFTKACKYNKIEVVKLLLQDPRVDPSYQDNDAIRWASQNGHVEVVKLLLQDQRVDPSGEYKYIVVWGRCNNHVEVVKLLLLQYPIVDINDAIIWAHKNGHVEVVELLLQDTRVKSKVINYIRKI